MNLHLVPPEPKPEKTKRQKVLDRVAAAAPEHLAKCVRCGSMEFIETRIGVEMVNGQPKGGTKALICLHCFMRGERVVAR